MEGKGVRLGEIGPVMTQAEREEEEIACQLGASIPVSSQLQEEFRFETLF